MGFINSNTVTFLDVTDTSKIDVHISSNLPTVQIFSSDNGGTFTPNWEQNNLVLTATIYADSRDVSNLNGVTYKWSKAKNAETSWEPINNTTKTLTITTNALSNASTVRYKCEVKYNNKDFSNEISFAKAQSGEKGNDGTSAPPVQAEYSVDGISGWTPTLNTAIHKYIHLSYDGGKTWPSVFKIAGEDGTSVRILGSYDNASQLPSSYDGDIGDGYIVDGDLYVWNGSQWQNVGDIQGPKGDQGDSYYLFIRYADNASGSGMSANPAGKKYIGFYRSSVNQVPSDSNTSTWNWAKFVGDDAKSVVLSASSQVFKVDKSNTITPATITVTAQAINTTINSWRYSVDGGKTFSNTAPTGITRSGNTFTLTGSSIATNSVVIQASDGVYSDVMTIYKVSDGADGATGVDGKPAPIVFLTNENITFAANDKGQVTGTSIECNVVAYSGTTKVTPTIGTITDIPSGMTIGTTTTRNNEIVIPITIANNTTLGSAQNIYGSLNIPVTSPVPTTLKLNWSKINSGRGIADIVEHYAVSSSNTTPPTSWQESTVPATTTTNRYLWNYETITYTDGDATDTTKRVIGTHGATGSAGRGITAITNYYLATTTNSGITTSTPGWTTTVQNVTATNKYLWNYEEITYTTGNPTRTTPNVIGAYGDTGQQGIQGPAGKGILSITEHYAVSSSNTTAPTTWQTTVPATTTTNRYLWNYETITYTVGEPTETAKRVIGTHGATGSTGSAGRGISSITNYYLATASASGVTHSTTGWTTTAQNVTATNKYLWNYEEVTYTSGNPTKTEPSIIGAYGDKGEAGKSGIDLSQGKMLHIDPTFMYGNNEVYTYDNNSSGQLLLTREAKSTDNPTKSNYELVIKNIGSNTSPALGGFTFIDKSRPNATLIYRIIAKIPVGYKLLFYTNSVGTDDVREWLSNNEGTGKFTEYLYKVQCGSTGTFSYTGYFAISGDAGTENNPVIWNLAYATCFDMTDLPAKSLSTVTNYYLASNVSSNITTSTSGWTTTPQNVSASNRYLWNYEVMSYSDGTSITTTPALVSAWGDAGSTGNGINSITEYYAISNSNTIEPTTWSTSVQSMTASNRYLWNYEIIQYTDGTTKNTSKRVIGVYGDSGTPASLVKITPSSLYFKSTTGKDGTFTPEYIYLYPRFQSVTYSNWQYSTNGGASWTNVSGANGLTVGTYNSVANSLRIAGTSTLYTDAITSISFRCNSSDLSVYDTVSIVKIYDVVDLTVGDKNLLLNSGLEITKIGYDVASYKPSEYLIQGEEYTLLLCVTPASNVTRYSPYLSGGYARQGDLEPSGLEKQILSLTFKAKYSSDKTPQDNDNYGNITFYRFPNDGTVTEGSIFHWVKLVRGNKATPDWTAAPEDVRNVTFQAYAPNGYLLTNELPSLSLQTFAFDGSVEIISGATYQWSHLIDNTWVDISGATNKTLTVTKSDVLKSKSYKCEMIYKSKTYSSTVTVQDKTDTYNSVMAISSNVIDNDCYWILYTMVYNDTEEVDPLLGPISATAPSSPTSGAYWYAVDTANATVQLKKYNGSSWVNSTDTQSLSYYWDLIDDGSANAPIGTSSKVQVISCRDFTGTATVVCEVNNVEDGLLTQSSLTLTDVSDPIVSTEEPTNVMNGQIWIKPNGNSTYLMFVWDEANASWISSDMDKRNKVYTSKPTSYSKGDLWITESDTVHTSYLAGTLLQASKDNTTYNVSDWSTTLKYDKDIDDMKETLNGLSEYVNITSEGLRIGAVSASGQLSPFTSLFTSTELSFYQNSEKLLTLANNQLIAPKIVVEDDLDVQGTINLGNLKLVIEDNGSFSFAVAK